MKYLRHRRAERETWRPRKAVAFEVQWLSGWHVRCSVPAAVTASHSPHMTLVAMSLLRLGSDTRAQRAFQDSLWPSVSNGRESLHPSMLERVLALAGVPTSERPRLCTELTARAIEILESAPSGLELLTRIDPRYPALLQHIPDPPLALWVSGDLAALSRPSVAVVGSRRASTVGLEIARRLGAELARAGLVVVSGLARGIDGAAHRGALDVGGATIAVLGNGADAPYPPQHLSMASDIKVCGLLVTEFPPGTPPYPSHFPLRNRIISGLCRATVVVEASERSGSLITARVALEQGREVLAVPGNALSGAYRGCHALIKDGAALVETVEDVLSVIGWTGPPAPGHDHVDKSHELSHLESIMAPGAPMSVDDLAARTGRSVADWLAELGALEVAGTVVRTAGGLFVRLDGPATNRER